MIEILVGIILVVIAYLLVAALTHSGVLALVVALAVLCVVLARRRV